MLPGLPRSLVTHRHYRHQIRRLEMKTSHQIHEKFEQLLQRSL